MAIDRVETATHQGQRKTSGTILLDAFGQLRESSPADSAVDVLGHTVTLKDRDGSISGLEIQTPTSANQSTGETDMHTVVVPSTVDGDYVLMAPTAGASNVDLHVAGALNVVSLGTSAGQTVALSSDGDMVVAADLNVGSAGTIDLDAGGHLSVAGRLTAGTLNIGAFGELALTDLDVGTIRFDVTGGGLTITNASSLVVGAGSVDGGLRITSDGKITFNDNVTASGDVTVTADGAIAINGGKLLDAGGGDVTLIATGGISGLVDAAELNLQAAGVVSVRDPNNVTVNGFVQNTAGSSVTVTAGGGITLATNVSSGDGNVTLDADGGTLAMNTRTVIDAGAGRVTLEASDNVLLAHVASSGTGSIGVTSQTGSITGPLTGTALAIPTGTVQLSAAAGIGQGDGLTMEAARLDVENTTSGTIRISEADGLIIQSLQQGADGSVSVTASGGELTVAGSGITSAGGSVTLHDAATECEINVDAPIITGGGDVRLVSDYGNIVFSAHVDAGAGDIDVTASAGDIRTTRTGWTVGDPVTPDLTSGGTMRLIAHGVIGEGAADERISTKSLVVDAGQLSAQSLSGQPLHIITTGHTRLGESGTKRPILTGGAKLVSLGTMHIAEHVSGGGEDIHLLAHDLEVSHPLHSPGGKLTISPLLNHGVIALGDRSADVSGMHLAQSELNHLAEGFHTVTIGGNDGAYKIHIGDADNSASKVHFSDPLVLRNTKWGGHIDIHGWLFGTDNASFRVHGSGNTTVLHDATIDKPGEIVLDDAVQIDGTVTVNSRNDRIDFLGILDGDGTDGDDTLTLDAAANITFAETIGGTDPLESLTITAADVVTFSQPLVVSGDVIITAGTVIFEAGVSVTDGGNLTITADTIQVDVGIAVAGDITFVADEIDLLGGVGTVESTGGGSLAIRTRTEHATIATALGEVDGRLDLSAADLAAFTDGGFSRIEIGLKDGDHAAESAGPVLLGGHNATVFLDPTFVYASTITVADETDSGHVLTAAETLELNAVGTVEIANHMIVTGDLTIYSADGAVEQDADTVDGQEAESLTVSRLTVRAHGGVHLPWIEVDSLHVTNVSEGDILITQVAGGGDITVQNLQQQAIDHIASLTTEDGDIVITGPVSAAGAAEVALTASGADGDIRLEQSVQTTGAGHLRLSATGDVDITAAVTTASGHVQISADGNVNLAETGSVSSVGAGMGVVEITAGGNVVLSQIESDDTATITAQTGAITDGLADESLNITTSVVSLSAATGIGAAGDGDIDIDVDEVSAAISQTGGVFLDEAAAAPGIHLTDDGVLEVIGSDADDYILVAPLGRDGIQVDAKLGPLGVVHQTFASADVERVAVSSGDGNDFVRISRLLAIPVVLKGDAGDDFLRGTNGPNVILGGPGNDTLVGGYGHDVLNGGEGQDLLMGYDGTDVLVGAGSNHVDMHDVNGDGHVTPLDVLLLLNNLNANGSRRLDEIPDATSVSNACNLNTVAGGWDNPTSCFNSVVGGPFLDVNLDDMISPLDLLHLINRFNAEKASGEGESPQAVDRFDIAAQVVSHLTPLPTLAERPASRAAVRETPDAETALAIVPSAGHLRGVAGSMEGGWDDHVFDEHSLFEAAGPDDDLLSVLADYVAQRSGAD
ncbi:MAG: hypothetical protein H8E44_25015 [Planctomycetes bacterium]|nr:hypothetical protein [Planctomycetota bacterium]